MMNRLPRIGDRVNLSEGLRVLVAIEAGVVTVRDPETGEASQLSAAEFAERLGADAEPDRRDDFLGHSTAEVRTLAAHLEEVLTGEPVDTDGPRRAEYDPESTLLRDRLRAKSEELTRLLGRGYSFKSLERKLAAYRKEGLRGIVDGRLVRPDAPLARADPRIVDALQAVIDAEVPASTGTARRLRLKTEAELARLYPGAEILNVSEVTFWRYQRTLGAGRYVTGNAANRRSVANRPSWVFSPRPAALPGQEVQIDSSPWDIAVLDHRGKPKRAVLTVMLDKATHCVIACSVLVEAAKGHDHAILLARALIPAARRPQAGREWVAELPPSPDLPWLELIDPAEREEVEAARPQITPQRIMTDNGADYLSATFRDACQAFGISITEASVHTPTDKGAVERLFASIKTGFAQYLPGFTGGSVDRRGRAPEKDPGLLDIATLSQLFEAWITHVWHNTETAGLADPVFPGMKRTPNTIYRAMFPYSGFVPIPLSPDDYIALLPVDGRTIQADGIRIGYRRYDSPRLAPYRLRRASDGKKLKQWKVRYDPYDPSFVWVRDPDDGSWIECEWMNREWHLQPFAQSIRRQAQKIAPDLPGYTHLESARFTTQVIAATPRAQTQIIDAKNRAAVAISAREPLQIPATAPAATEPPASAPPVRGTLAAADHVDDIRPFDPEDFL